MKPARHTRHHHRHGSPKDRHPHDVGCPGWLRTWMFTCALASGVLALLWLLLRSGTKPSRFAYPCQQAALSAASLAFGAPLVATLVAARRRAAAALCTPTGVAVAVLGLLLTAGLWASFSRADEYGGPRLDPPDNYRAQLYHVTDCPQDPVGDRFVGLDNLIMLMGHKGLKFYRSANGSLEAGPDGILAADNVVVIKINYQWDERGGTNVDLLRGLIRRIVDHPDGFTGEIVVCENAQFVTVSNFDRTKNNAQDHSLSPHDVVVQFQDLGYTISHYDWTNRRFFSVDEYSVGDMTDGYVVYPYNPQVNGRVSYPKFQTSYDTYISIKHGIWDPASEIYNRNRLKFINVPVLKSHHATYGATACVKNYMGVVTRELDTNSHSAIRYGILGALLGEIQLADLNILDCIWINANPWRGPRCRYTTATRNDELIASLDPVATDIWAVKNILIPGFIANGFSPPWPYPSADPNISYSAFRRYLDNSMYQILAAGYNVTNNLYKIDVYNWNGEVNFDCNDNGMPDIWDIEDGTSQDCNENDVPDECDIAEGTSQDCNENDVPDECDIAEGTSKDCNGNGVPDECEDCNNNGVADECDIANGTSRDCNSNVIPDECDLADCDGSPWCDDCNGNGVPDECDLDLGLPWSINPSFSQDCNENNIPDECDIAEGTSNDCNGNVIPDECDLEDCEGSAWCDDCNDNGILDECDISNYGPSKDCNLNGVPDECEVDPCPICDLNGDGMVNERDLEIMRECLNFQAPYEEANCQVADLDGDGEITWRDWDIFIRCYREYPDPSQVDPYGSLEP